MLDLMRKHAGTWLVKFILGAIIIVFSFWGVGSYRAQRGNRVAVVNGQPVTMDEYRSSYDRLLNQFRQRFGESFNQDLIKALKLEKQALDQVIEQKLLHEEAVRLDFRVSDSELARTIRDLPFFQTAGSFDPKRYKSVLSANRMTPDAYEENQREAMLQDKLRSFVVNGVKVSDLEAREWYNWSQATMRIDYVLVDPSSMGDGLTPKEEDLRKYYQENRSDYETSPQVRARFVRFLPSEFRSQVVVTPEDIADDYDAGRSEFKTKETVDARHILVRLEEGASESDVAIAQKKAEEIYRKAAAGEDFATLARTYSEGPSRDNGGHLGAFSRGSMVKAFEEKAFSMKAGDISEPIRTRFGLHIIKVEKKTPATEMTLAEATPQIRETLTAERAKTLAFDAADAFYEASFQGDDLGALAATQELTAEETAFFTKAEGPAQVTDKARFAEVAFALPVNEISDVQEMSDGFFIIQLLEKRPASLPAFESVLDSVQRDWLTKQKDEKAKAEAGKVLEALKKGDKTLATLAGQMGLPLATTDFFQRSGTIPGVGYEPALSAEAFGLTPEQPRAEKVIKGGKGYFVIELKDRKQPDDDGFEKVREQIVQQLLTQKQSRVYSDLVADLRSRSEIKIEPGFLDE
ncbi:MAG: SurA N-terminal domain-containing protein [Desulfobacterales bacterium]|nr:SurA N-terminal domain-containing protein [Desulfobacterales bacterium]